MPALRSKQILAPEKQFLAFPDHYVNVTGLMAKVEFDKLLVESTDFGGEKVIQRGTKVHISDTGVVTQPTYVETTNEAGTKANGIIFNTIKETEYDATDTHMNATVLVHGFVRVDRLIGDAPIDNALIYVIAQ